MNQAPSTPTRRRLASATAASLALALVVAACGSSAPASVALPSVALPSIALPSIALPSIALPSIALPSIALPSTNPGASGGTAGVDPAVGLTIDPPYALTALPGALQTTLETQMATSLGAFGQAIKFGFRQITGGAGMLSILMVISFPSGSLNAQTYEAALTGMGGSMGATFTKTTVDGIDVSSGTMTTGGVAIFHVGDTMLVVISPTPSDALPVATALVNANN
jgi:hypothetical protein